MLLAKAREVKEYGNKPALVKRINFHGIKRTKDDALLKETSRLFHVKTLKELVYSAYQAQTHLQHVGLFSDAVVFLDVDQKESTSDGYEVTFLVKEPKAYTGSLSVGVDNRGEAQGTVQFDRGSALGRAEKVSAQTTKGVRGTTLFNLSLNKPLLGWQRYTGVGANLYRSYGLFPYSNFSALDTGLVADLYFKTFGSFEHQIKWNAAWRQLEPSAGAAFAVREHAGHSLKSSLEHVLAYSTQDNSILPQRGLLLRLSQEYAGLGGDVRFLRNQLEMKASAPVPLGMVLSLGLQANHVLPRSGRSLNLMDRTHIGGPTDLRGFEHNAVGPVADGSYLGGTGSWCAALHLYRPLIPSDLMFAHAFAVAGNIHGTQEVSFSEMMRRLAQQPRVSVGFGLAVKLQGVARLEFNYSIPIRFQATDAARPGFQFGAGISFL